MHGPDNLVAAVMNIDLLLCSLLCSSFKSNLKQVKKDEFFKVMLKYQIYFSITLKNSSEKSDNFGNIQNPHRGFKDGVFPGISRWPWCLTIHVSGNQWV